MSRQRRVQSRPSPTPSRFRPGWAAGGAALAALGLLAVILFPADGQQDASERSAEQLPAAEPAAGHGGDDLHSTSVLAADLPVADGVFLSRDPFEPVVPEEEPAPDPDPTDPDPDDPDADPTDPDDPDPVDTDPDGCQDNAELVCDGQVLTLLEVSDPNGDPTAVFQVNTTQYEVSPGDAFADGFVLEQITGNGCAWVSYGDEAHLQCPGEVRLK